MSREGLLLLVDPIACDGYGSCCELVPEWISSDEWGFPIIPRQALPEALVPLVRRAVNSCPRLALSLVPAGGATSS